MQSPPKKPEILAPAGSLESFFAAMETGADAVYAGLTEFSARAKAKNFTLPLMAKGISYAHAHNRKVYVTLNTLVKERELPQLVETLSELEAMRVDGVILQDLGVWRLIREHFPGIPLHASTQMTVHNLEGVRQLEEMGFERVVLARELHIDAIRHITENCRAEIECFIHGALCFSFSGQCYFSSYLGGLSGNRGRCAQPCRRRYRAEGKEGFYLSTNDFSALEMVHDLAEAGVASLKIEGRMKSAEYVACIVRAYRRVLDAPAAERGEAVREAKELVKQSLGRTPTRGFLGSVDPTDIATPHLAGSTGRFLGKVTAAKAGYITFQCRDALRVGDRIRVQPQSDRPGKAYTVKEFRGAKGPGTVTVEFPFPCTAGDGVFKVSSDSGYTISENACLRRLQAAGAEKRGVDLVMTLADGMLAAEAVVEGLSFSRTWNLGPLEEGRTADMRGVLEGQFSRTGDTAFFFRSLSAPEFPRVAIPPARLKEIRRDLYAWLEEELLPRLLRRQQEKKSLALAELQAPGAGNRGRGELWARLDHAEDFFSLPRDLAAAVILPLTPGNLRRLHLLAKRVDRHERIVWSLPFIIFDADIPWFREAAAAVAAAGFRRFEASNLSHFRLLPAGCDVVADYRLFSLNTQAMKGWRELGCSSVTLYIEDDRENMLELLAAPLDLQRNVVIFAPVDVITSRIRIRSLKKGAVLHSERGDRYPVQESRGLTVVTAERPFSIAHFSGELREAGAAALVADLSPAAPRERNALLQEIARGQRLENTIEFNFRTGLV